MKSRIGPFALEAPLSPQKSSGQVFRALHLQQHKLAALRIFPIPLGLTPESRHAFASQLEQLKQLRHPAIVRCYGGGFDTRNAFLASELVEGESLQDQLARRGQLPWETAFDYAQQLAEGLQYAHQMGWVHGRLRPSKILIGSDGSAKINDWRKAAITSMIDSGPPTEATIQFAPPEVLRGESPDEKSDLYALGASLYAMLTGQPPFTADSHEQLTQLVLQQSPAAVSSHVLDCPVWLNAVVDQLLAKDPRQRPFSAAAVQLAFKEAQRRQAEGVGVLQHVTAGFSPLQMKLDRDEAEKVLGLKKKKKRKQDLDTPFFERPWVLSLALLLAVATVVWFLLPLSEKRLRARAEAMLPPESDSYMDWKEAKSLYLAELVERFPEGEHAEWAEEQLEWVATREAERALEREERLGLNSDWTQAEFQYAAARKYERFGDLSTAFDKYRAIVRLFAGNPADRPVANLALEGIDRIKQKGLEENQLQRFLNAQLADAARAYERGRITDAKLKWESIVELYAGNQEVAPLVTQAQQRLDELSSPQSARPK